MQAQVAVGCVTAAGSPRPGGGDSRPMPQGKKVQQPVTDDSIQVRQLSHYQFSWVAGDPGEEGTFTLQLVLDEGAWEEVLTVDAEDAEVLQSLLKRQEFVHYDIRRRTLMFGTTPVGH
jgi:hypothetical protein